MAQWSECWTLGRTARVRVLDGALRCGLKQVASLTLLRLLDGTSSLGFGVGDVNFPRRRLLCDGYPPLVGLGRFVTCKACLNI